MKDNCSYDPVPQNGHLSGDDFDNQDEQQQLNPPIHQNKNHNNDKKSQYNKLDIITYMLIIVLFLGCLYQLNIFLSKISRDSQQIIDKQPIEQKQIGQGPKIYTDFYSDKLDELEYGTKYQISQKAQKRVMMGQPKPQPRYLSSIIITNQKYKKQKYCGILNGILVVTQKSTKSINNLLESGLQKIVIFVDRKDNFADQILQKTFQNSPKHSQLKYQKQNITVDSDNQQILQSLGTCQKIIYLQNYFEINSEQSSKLVKILKQVNQYQVIYSAICQIREEQTKLADLSEIDISEVNQKQLNKYVFLVCLKALKILGPLNFAYYNKYTLQQIIIYPLLALTQKTKYLKNYSDNLHSIDESFIQFKQFALRPARSQSYQQHYCFVSYPSDPQVIDISQSQAYFNSLINIQTVSDISIIIFLPYNIGQTQDNINFVRKLIQFLEYTKTQQRLHKYYRRVKLILKNRKSVSSLSVYESAYTYCPPKSLIISSRHNIQFKSTFLTSIYQIYSTRQHYYVTGFSITDKQKPQDFLINQNFQFPQKRYEFRNNAPYYNQYFQHLQIFKSDLLKMLNFQLLKCKQIDFYQSQASYVLPMLQMIKLRVGIIKDVQYQVKSRLKSDKQNKQFSNIKKYFQMIQIPNNILNPYPLDGLGNIAFRKNAVDRISKKLHQVWIGNTQPQNIRMKLHETLKQANSQYKVFLWKQENLTVQNFPLTHSLIHRSLQYQKQSNRSYLAPIVSLIRYEALLHEGGVYLDFKTQGLKPLDPFLKYEIFFTDSTVNQDRYGNPNYLGNPIMGAQQNSYYLNFILTQLINQQKMDYSEIMFPKIVGAYVLRKGFQTRQIFNNIGLGFHLFSPRPVLEQNSPQEQSLCLKIQQFSEQQQVYQINDLRNNKIYKVGIPCHQYPQAYAIQYRPLGRTWVQYKKRK